jgi:hypothetical protein
MINVNARFRSMRDVTKEKLGKSGLAEIEEARKMKDDNLHIVGVNFDTL